MEKQSIALSKEIKSFLSKNIFCTNLNCLNSMYSNELVGFKLHGKPKLKNAQVLARVKCMGCGKTISLLNWKIANTKRGRKSSLIYRKEEEFKNQYHFYFVEIVIKIANILNLQFYECASEITNKSQRSIQRALSRDSKSIDIKTCLKLFVFYKELMFVQNRLEFDSANVVSKVQFMADKLAKIYRQENTNEAN